MWLVSNLEALCGFWDAILMVRVCWDPSALCINYVWRIFYGFENHWRGSYHSATLQGWSFPMQSLHWLVELLTLCAWWWCMQPIPEAGTQSNKRRTRRPQLRQLPIPVIILKVLVIDPGHVQYIITFSHTSALYRARVPSFRECMSIKFEFLWLSRHPNGHVFVDFVQINTSEALYLGWTGLLLASSIFILAWVDQES